MPPAPCMEPLKSRPRVMWRVTWLLPSNSAMGRRPFPIRGRSFPSEVRRRDFAGAAWVRRRFRKGVVDLLQIERRWLVSTGSS
jgi:hypothetical protein